MVGSISSLLYLYARNRSFEYELSFFEFLYVNLQLIRIEKHFLEESCRNILIDKLHAAVMLSRITYIWMPLQTFITNIKTGILLFS